MLTRARTGGALAVALFALFVSTGAPAHAETVPSPDPTGEVIEEPAVPPGSEPYTEPTIPEGTFEPAPTGPVPTEVPTVAPPAPVATSFDYDPAGSNGSDRFRTEDTWSSSGGMTSGTSGRTGSEGSRDTAPAPQIVEPKTEPTGTPTASPTPVATTAPASPVPDDARGGSAGSGAAVPSTSVQRASTPTLSNLVIGMTVLVVGLVIVRFRGPVFEAAARGGSRQISGGLSGRAERLRGPFLVGVAGAVIAFIGIVMNGYAGWQLWGALSA